MTARVKSTDKKGKKPEYKDVAKAVGYWVILNDLCDFFKNNNMPKVHKHLSAACKEIDAIWKEYESKK